jgi:integrase
VNYLARRNGSVNWYYRESIPADIRDLVARATGRRPKEVWISLGVPDQRRAKDLLAGVRADQHRKWADLRKSALPGMVPSSADLTDAVVDFVHDGFVEGHRRSLREKLAGAFDATSEAKRRREKIIQAELFPSPDDAADMERVSNALCRKLGWDLGPGEGIRGDRWVELVGLVTKAIQHARSQIVDTLEGRPVSNDRDAVIDRLGGARRQKADAGESIADLFNLYEADCLRRGKSSDTLSTERKVVEHFASFVGRDRAVKDIGRTEIREFKRALARVPHRWVTKAELKGMSLADAANRWAELGGKGRSPRTVDKELSAISSFFVWLIRNAYYEGANPTRDFFDRVDKKQTKYPPYTQEQLKAVFGSPLFGTCNPHKPHLAGKTRVRDWRYWIPICALYSGARAGEIAQLLCADIRQEQGTWVFDFNDEGGFKSLKNRSSKRIVPIHSALIRLGLLDHMTKLRDAGHTRLFPDLEPGPRGDISYQPSKFWQKYLKNIGVKERGLALHSFRHGFTDECRRNGVSKDVLQGLLGHSDGSMTGHYGTLPWGTLVERKSAIDSLSFGALHAATITDEVAVAA